MKILSLGAGVQSSTILLMSCYGDIDKIDAAVFADTGWEPKKVYKWLNFLTIEAKRHGIPIYSVSKGNIREDTLRSKVRGGDGKRAVSMPFYTSIDGKNVGMIKRQCTYDYKIAPLQAKFRELLGYKRFARIPCGELEIWKGISIDEAKRATIAREKWIEFYYPLIELGMTRYDCLNWFKKKGLSLPPRSSCLGCPYHSDKEWLNIKKNSPNEWQDVIEFDEAIRCLGGIRGKTYLHKSLKPLNQVDFKTPEEMGQLNMFSDECMGVCGV